MKPRLMIIAAAALLAIHGNAATAATQAGVSAAVRGEIDLAPVSGEAMHQTASGEDIYLGDGISSHDNAGMQLMLLDETVFTIGANTEMTVDEFVYDPATGAGAVTASVAKGVFRFVTGNIAQGDPEDMTIKLPVGTIGIRGTIGAASMIGGIAAVVLLGPGPDNNADARQGHLEVSAEGVTVDLTRPRWGTTIEPGQPPTPPALFSDAQISDILGALGSAPQDREPSDPVDDGVATTLANQDLAVATEFAEFVAVIDETDDDLNGNFDNACVVDCPGNDRTTFGDLPTQGLGVYEGTVFGGHPLSDGGRYIFDLDIDFGNRIIGGTADDIFIRDSPTFPFSVGGFFGINFAQQSFDDAVLASSGTPLFEFKQEGVVCGSQCDVTLTVLLGNAGDTADHALSIINTTEGTSTSGSGTSSFVSVP